MNQIITRIWHGVTLKEKSEDYLQYLLETGVKDYKSTPGNLSVTLWRRIESGEAHFWTVTTWDNFDSIKKFAGDDFNKARYYPKDKEFLIAFEPTVIHCETWSL